MEEKNRLALIYVVYEFTPNTDSKTKEAIYTALQCTDVQIKHSLHRACELPRVPLFII